MFHAKRPRSAIPFFLVTLFLTVSAPLSSLYAATPSDSVVANHVADLLYDKFKPEGLSVTVRDSRAYAEMKGAVISDIRIDTMRLDALLVNLDKPLVNDVDSLASLIGFSRGELVLAEKDVNDFFKKNDTKGFSKLVFDFTPKGFLAKGIFSADFIVTFRIRLAATGFLALKSDGVHLDKTSIFVENIKQPDSLTERIVNRINPLLEWRDIPFKVEFSKITMDEEATRMTGHPKKLEAGFTAVRGAR